MVHLGCRPGQSTAESKPEKNHPGPRLVVTNLVCTVGLFNRTLYHIIHKEFCVSDKVSILLVATCQHPCLSVSLETGTEFSVSKENPYHMVTISETPCLGLGNYRE